MRTSLARLSLRSRTYPFLNCVAICSSVLCKLFLLNVLALRRVGTFFLALAAFFRVGFTEVVA